MFAGAVVHCYTGKSARDREGRCERGGQRWHNMADEGAQVWGQFLRRDGCEIRLG